MKILIVHNRFFVSGGPERYMFSIIKELTSLGHIIVPFSVKNRRNVPGPYEKYFVKNVDNSDEFLFNNYKKSIRFYINYFAREFYSLYIKNKLEILIKEEKPDICYLLTHKANLSVSVINACKKYKIPIVHRISDYNILCIEGGLYRNRKYCEECKTNKLNGLKHKCVKNSLLLSLIRFSSNQLHTILKIYEKVDHFITTNEFAYEVFLKFGFDKSKFTTIRTFSNVEKTDTNPVIRPFRNFLFLGNVDDSKGIYDLIEAIKSLVFVKNCKQFHLSIYGGLHKIQRDNVERMINEFRLKEYIDFNLPVPSEEISRVFSNNDVTILPTRWVENLPNVLIESLSYNRPVVVPGFGSFKATLDDTVAFFYEPYSVDSLCDLLFDIVKYPDKIRDKSLNCANYIQKNFSKEQHIKKLIEIFEKYLNENN